MSISDRVSDEVLKEAIGLSDLAHSMGFDRMIAFDNYLYHVKFIDDPVKRRDYLLDVSSYYNRGVFDE